MAATAMKHFHNVKARTLPEYKTGDQVMLDTKFLSLDRPSKKLLNKRTRPFTILERTSTTSYKIKLPPRWKTIHPVVHVQLLSPYQANTIPGRTQPIPTPDVIEGIEEFEVKQILDSHIWGRYKHLQYLIQWKGYSDIKNSWEPPNHLSNAMEAILEFHQAHPNCPKPRKGVMS